MLLQQFQFLKSIGNNFKLGGTKIVQVYGEGGPFLNLINEGLSLENYGFGDTIQIGNPERLSIRKEENNLQFAHTFPGNALNGIWDTRELGVGNISVADNLLTITQDGTEGAQANILHQIILKQTDLGNIIFETRLKRDAESGAPGCWVGMSGGFGETDSDYVLFRMNETSSTTTTTTWIPAIRSAGGAPTIGTSFTHPNNEPLTLRIELTATTAKFYANDILKDTLSGVELPEEHNLSAVAGVREVANDACTLKIAWIRIEYGAII